jgi:cytochrome c556
MNWRRVTEGLLATVAAGVIGTWGFAAAADEALEDSMQKALDGLQPILVGLVNSDHEAVLKDVGPILEHASRLTQAVPDSAKDDRDQYLSYAYNLQENSKILKSTIEALLKDDEAAAAQAGLRMDYLPVVAATHFGGIVNMCVACHSRFRIPLEK